MMNILVILACLLLAYVWLRKPKVKPEVPCSTIFHVKDKLFWGSRGSAADIDVLTSRGIGAIVNLAVESVEKNKMIIHPSMNYMMIPLRDSDNPDDIRIFKATLSSVLQFIHLHLQQKRAVLVHCEQGVSRSTAYILAHLVTHGYALKEALEFLRSIRANAKPNNGFMRALVSFANEFYSDSSLLTSDFPQPILMSLSSE
jgi:predicted protein tyrosine phosphatase